jgi:hypothetical protein
LDVYFVKPKNLAGCSFDNLDETIEELKMHIQDGVDEVKVVRKTMTEEEYQDLPEFEGY